jgi:dihydroorotase
MHPGPINRGVEIDSEVVDSDYSVILDQVTNGVAVRMAVLYLLLGAESVKGEMQGIDVNDPDRTGRTDTLLLKGARLLDPGRRAGRPCWTCACTRGASPEIGPGAAGRFGEGAGPGRARWSHRALLDLRARFGEPGQEERETIASGLRAAAAGGLRRGVHAARDRARHRRCRRAGLPGTSAPPGTAATLLPVACVTRGGTGEILADLAELVAAGAVAFSDGNKGLPGAHALRGSLLYARQFGRPIFELPAEASLLGGEVHEGRASLRSGLKGIPAIAEDIAVYRGIRCAEYEQSPLHLQLLSTKESIALLASAPGIGACP